MRFVRFSAAMFAAVILLSKSSPLFAKEGRDDDIPKSKSSIIIVGADGIPLDALRDAEAFERQIRIYGGPDIPSIQTLLPPAEKVKAFQARMNASLVGQPEVVDVFTEIERQKMMAGYGRRETPEIVYLVGLSGTGKDTATKAYVNSMHGHDGHKKHLYSLPVAKSKDDLWRVFGSNTGYVGSDESQPDFIKFLVEHSGGRYSIERNGKKEFVVENPHWRPKSKIRDTVSPEDAVVYIDEFHDWALDAKNAFFKQAFEKGYFPINSPGEGVSKIYVPVTFVVASNECVELVAARDMYGNKVGKSLKYADLLKKWEKVHTNKAALIKAIKNQRVRQIGNQTTGGISEELIGRVPKRNLVLMRPLSPEAVRKIALSKISLIEAKYATAEGDFGNIRIDIKDSVIDFVAEYNFDAEDGARALEDKAAWIENAITAALYEHGDHHATGHRLTVDLQKNADKTYSLSFVYETQQNDKKTFDVAIREAQQEKPVERLKEDRLTELSSVAEKMKQRVFGIDPIADRMQRALIVNEERSHSQEHDSENSGAPARVFMFLGLSSTGKTEATKAFADVSPGGKETAKMFDFSSVRTVQDLKDKILGTKDEFGRPKKSPFMEHYDKYDGKVTFVFDEFANAPREILKALYDILREAVVTTFSDGEPRSMSGVKIILTGNAGEEWFVEIPRDIPKFMQMFAMQEVYEQSMQDPGYRRKILEQYFSEALLNRIGEQNIFFFPPLSFKAIRQLTEMKTSIALKKLKATESAWGWDVQFASDKDYNSFLEIVETDGFVIREQGASIDRFVNQDFAEALRAKLLENRITPGSAVAISFVKREDDEDEVRSTSFWNLHVEGRAEPLSLEIEGAQDNKSLEPTQQSQIITAYHEIGHALVRQALLGDKFVMKRVSIIPGVAKFGTRWIRYLGVAQSRAIAYADATREKIVADLAILLAGEAAELLVANQTSGGKSSDISRATEVAQRAIIYYGLSSAWGNFAPGPGVSFETYILGLSESRRLLLEREVRKLLAEGQELARATILENYDTHFIPMSLELAEKGDMKAADIDRHFKRTPVRQPMPSSSWGKMADAMNPMKASANLWKWMRGERKTRDATLLPSTPMPASVANITSVVNQYRAKEISSIAQSVRAPVLASKEAFPSLRGMTELTVSCEGTFE